MPSGIMRRCRYRSGGGLRGSGWGRPSIVALIALMIVALIALMIAPGSLILRFGFARHRGDPAELVEG